MDLLDEPSAEFNCDSSHTCEQCGKVFSDILEFVTHKQYYHNVRHYFCELCEKVFDVKKIFADHLVNCEKRKRFICDQCEASFNHEFNINLHKALHAEDVNCTMTCPECRKTFSRLASFKCHVLMHQLDETVTCDKCAEEFTYYYELQKHLKLIHDPLLSAATRVYPCKQCDAVFKRPLDLAEHRIRHKKIKDSLKTKKKSLRKSAGGGKYNKHSSKRIECVYCQKIFNKPSTLARHLVVHTGEKSFVCKVCNKRFNQKGSLMIHEARHLSEKPYKCQLCGAGFSQQGNLRLHVKRVHPENPTDHPGYECPLCSCILRTFQSLNCHLSRRHEEALQYVDASGRPKFDVSGFRFNEAGGHSSGESPGIRNTNFDHQDLLVPDQPMTSSQYSVSQLPPLHRKNAVLTEHTEEVNLFSIPQICISNSAIVSDKNVIMNHHEEAQQSTVIPLLSICGDNQLSTGNVDKNNAKMENVNRIVLENGIRRWPCRFCGKKLVRSSDLIRHLRVHTGEKPFKCQLCSRQFALRSTLESHERRHYGVKPVRCYICFKELSTKGSLKAHMRIHNNEFLFCPICQTKRFRTRAQLNRHYRHNHHGNRGHVTNNDENAANGSRVPAEPVSLSEPLLETAEGRIVQWAKNQDPYESRTAACSTDRFGRVTYRPFACHACPLRFKKRSFLQVHMRAHTGERPYACRACRARYATCDALKDHLTRAHSGVRNHACSACAKMFATRRAARRHAFVHSDARPFLCPYCGKRFRRGVLCRRHIKTHATELRRQRANETATTFVVDGNNCDAQVYGDGGLCQQQEQTESVLAVGGGGCGVQNFYDSQPTTSGIIDGNFADVSNGNVWLVNSSDQQHHHHAMQMSSVIPTNNEEISGCYYNDRQTADVQNARIQFSQKNNSVENVPNALTYVQQTDSVIINPDILDSPTSSSSMSHLITGFSPNGLQNLMHELADANLSQQHHVVLATTSQQQQQQQPNVVLNIISNNQQQQQHSIVEDSDCNQYLAIPAYLIRDASGGDNVYAAINIVEPAIHQTASSSILQSTQTTSGDVQQQYSPQAIAGHLCQECSTLMSSTGALHRHLRVVHKQRKTNTYECPICCKSFARASHVTRHVFDTHRDADDALAPVAADAEVARILERISSPPPPVASMVAMATETSTCESQPTVKQPAASTKRRARTTSRSKFNMSGHLTLIDLHNTADTSGIQKQQDSTSSAVATGYATTGVTALPSNASKALQQCPHCPKAFKKPSDLTRHLRCHTGEKPFMCEECGRTFRIKSTLTVHKRTHMEKPVTYDCRVCEKAFASVSSLKVHFRLHTLERPFTCPACPMTFRTCGQKRHHVKHVHNRALPEEQLSSVDDSSVVDDVVNDVIHSAKFCRASTSAFTPVVGKQQQQSVPPDGAADVVESSSSTCLMTHPQQQQQLVVMETPTPDGSNVNIVLRIAREAGDTVRFYVEPSVGGGRGVVPANQNPDDNIVIIESKFLRQLAADGLTLTIPITFGGNKIDDNSAGDFSPPGGVESSSVCSTLTLNPYDILYQANIDCQPTTTLTNMDNVLVI